MNVIVGIISIAIGGWLIAVGIAYSGDEVRFGVPGSAFAVTLIKLIPDVVLKIPVIGSFGALIPLGLPGLLIGLYGLRFMTNSGDQMEDEEEEEEKIDTSHLGGMTLGELVNMSQGTITIKQAETVIKNLRPNLLKSFNNSMEEGAIKALARNVLQHAIMNHQRKSQKNIAADQYSMHGKRMAELEKKPFGRRYMPSKDKVPTVKTKKAIGRVFDMHTQSTLEQEFASDTSDWLDVSIENMESAMAKKPASSSEEAA